MDTLLYVVAISSPNVNHIHAALLCLLPVLAAASASAD
jgi:hypothetical protein